MRQWKDLAPPQVGRVGELFVAVRLGCWVGNGGVKGFGRFAGKKVFPLHTVAQPVFSEAASREGMGHHIPVFSAPSLSLGAYLLGRRVYGQNIVIGLHFDDIRPDIRNGWLTRYAAGQEQGEQGYTERHLQHRASLYLTQRKRTSEVDAEKMGI